ncbi:DMT family transporter [Pantoea ananatis]|jgi:drug/metabolite transporter (DMT)-like permease|uniref:EamA domain-containing protein n=1 Tax=Pantoea ananatis (strain LMG 20103) TaxID=706191 RepID=D4GIV4_PANAM|nr:DMT family transporter [Pantoea ananatis]ADD75699.1 Hypothetical Protein PANA_0532 [Pantoea ananatis LMG 20103]URL16350.1 DMT family transporter [Pantoea ananatis]
MEIKTGAVFGLIMVLIYNFLDAGKEVYSGHLVQSLHPMLVTFIVFSTVLVFFQCIFLVKLSRGYIIPLQYPVIITLLNITTVGSWVTFFYCLRYIEPAIASAIITGFAPLIIVLISPFLYRNEKRQYRLSLLLGIALCSLWLSIISLQGDNKNYSYSNYEIVAGIFLAISCAFFSILSNILSKKLSDRKCIPESIMAHRFYLTIIVTFSYIYDVNTEHLSDSGLFPGVLFLAILGVILPLWCLQYAIKHLAPAKVMIFMSISPVFTYVFQLLDPRLSPTYSSLVAILLLCCFSLATEIWQIRHKGRTLDNGYNGVPEDKRS